MKKLLLFISFFTVESAHAVTKNDLAPAIRSLDVATVQQIIAHEKFTQREYDRYIDLADEMIRNREPWITRLYPIYDDATPYEGPSIKRLIPEGFLGYIGFLMGCASLAEFGEGICLKAGIKYDNRGLLLAGSILGFSIAGKCIYDFKKRFATDREYRKLLRKKYDDAVTIKQLVYMADLWKLNS